MKKNRQEHQQFNRTPVIISTFLVSVFLWFYLSLSQQYTMTIQVPFALVNAPEGFSSATVLPNQIKMVVKSTGINLFLLWMKQKDTFRASYPSMNVSTSVDLRKAVNDNLWLGDDIKVLEIYPEEITIDLEKTVSRSKKVQTLFTFTFKEGFGLASQPKIIPDSVITYGSKKILTQISSVLTEKREYRNLEESFSEEIPLKQINGIAIRPENVKVVFDIQRIVENKIVNLPVEVINVPPDRNVILAPGQLTVGIRGGIEIVGRVKPDEIKIFLDYKDIITDSLEYFIPQVQLPQNTELLYLEPSKVKAIIKRF